MISQIEYLLRQLTVQPLTNISSQYPHFRLGSMGWLDEMYLVVSTEKWGGGQQLLPGCKTLRPKQNDSHFRDIFKCIFVNQNIWILKNNISLTYVSVGSVDIMSSFVQVMALNRRKAINWTNDRYTAHWFISVYLFPHSQALHHWPFVRKSKVRWWISLTKGQLCVVNITHKML